MKKTLLLSILCVLFSSTCWATTYYIRQDGAATKANATGGCGSTATSMSVSTHNSAGSSGFSGGDTITICGDGGKITSSIFPPSSGSSEGSRITYNSSGSADLEVTGGTMWESGAIYIDGKSYITITGIEISSHSWEGIKILNSSYITVSNCTIYNIAITTKNYGDGEGVFISNSNNVIVTGCTIYNCGNHGVFVWADGDRGQSCSNITITHNEIYDIYHANIDTNAYNAGASISNVTIAYNKLYLTGSYDHTYSNDLISIKQQNGASTHTNTYIYNNLLYNGQEKLIWLNTQAGGSNTGVKIYNNTLWTTVEFFSGTSHGIQITNDSGTFGVDVKNNIIGQTLLELISVEGSKTGVTINYNKYYKTVGDLNNGWRTDAAGLIPYANFSTWQGQGFDANSSVGLPGFTSYVSPYNLVLTSSAPAKDVGTNTVSGTVSDDYIGTSRPQGSGWDLGAYEYPDNVPILRGVTITGGTVK